MYDVLMVYYIYSKGLFIILLIILKVIVRMNRRLRMITKMLRMSSKMLGMTSKRLMKKKMKTNKRLSKRRMNRNMKTVKRMI